MTPKENDVFGSMQLDIQYEGCMNEARAYLENGDYDKAIAAADRARGYLRDGADTAEVDALTSSARSTLTRIEQDKRELAQRQEQERARTAEQERLAREQAEQQRRQAEQENQARIREEERTKDKTKGLLWFIAAAAFLVPVYLYVVSLSGEWYGRRNIEIAFQVAGVIAIGGSIYMVIAESASNRMQFGTVLLWAVFVLFVVLLLMALLNAEHGSIEIPGVVVGLIVPLAVYGWRRM